MFLLVCALSVAVEYQSTARIVVQAASKQTTINGFSWQDLGGSGVYGGAAILYETTQQSEVTVSSCSFTSLFVGGGSSCPDSCKGGGAIFAEKVRFICNDCIFTDCYVVACRGGAISLRTESTANISSCKFIDCRAGSNKCWEVSGGGAVAVADGFLDISSSNFSSCTSASFGGGAIYAYAGINCVDCNFTSCASGETDANMTGGAIWATGSMSSSITGCNFTECSAQAAGAVYFTGDGLFDISATIVSRRRPSHAYGPTHRSYNSEDLDFPFE